MAKIIKQVEVASYESNSRPETFYKVLRVQDDENHVYYSCNCRSWTTGREQRGKQAWDRACKHTLAFQIQRGAPRAFTPADVAETMRLPKIKPRPRKRDADAGDIGGIEL